MDRGTWWATVHGDAKESDRFSDQQQDFCLKGIHNDATKNPLLMGYIKTMKVTWAILRQ